MQKIKDFFLTVTVLVFYWFLTSGVFVVMGILLLVATKEHPYDFYNTLKFLISNGCGWGIFLSVPFWDDSDIEIVIIITNVVIAIIFNTVFPLNLTKNIWNIIDIICAIIMFSISLYRVVHIFKIYQKNKK